MVNLKIRAFVPGLTNPVVVRAIIQKSDGSYVAGEWQDPGYPAISMRGKAVGPDDLIALRTGVTRITIGKGPDYLPQTIVTNLTGPGSTYTINVNLQPALDLYQHGWRAGDMHVHYIHGEAEIIREPAAAFAICAAGGLNFVSFCEEHYGANSLNRQQMIDAMKAPPSFESLFWLGLEEPKNAWGHHVNLLYDPWTIRSSLPYHLGIYSVHQQGGINYPVHPNRLFPGRYYDDPATHQRTWFFYPYNNFLKSYPLDALLGHVLDGWSGVSDEPNSADVLPPYFKLLQLGYRIPLLADSDACLDRLNNGTKAPGCWMTYYYLEGNPLARAAISTAVRKGRVMATTGPLVLFTIDDAMPGDTLPADGQTRTVRIEASFRFNPWTLSYSNFANTAACRIAQIDLFRNGQVIKTWTPNSSNIVVQHTINESASNSYYMVRVLGNDTTWMAGYASPIYFDNAPRPRQPPAFKSLIQGRLYDSFSGNSLTGTVSCVRYGRTEWTIPTDDQGRFQVYAPLDAELVARDSLNRDFTQDLLHYEPAYAFCHYLADNYPTNIESAIEPFRSQVQTMRWEFPIGYQYAASYVRSNLSGDVSLTNLTVVSAPAATPSKTNSEIVMLLLDKTQAQPGDTIHCSVLIRRPPGATDACVLEWKAWDPNRPSIFNKDGQIIYYDENLLLNLGNGFFLQHSTMVVPSWATNSTETTAGLKLFMRIMNQSTTLEDASLLVRIGPTKRQLLVSSSWDGLPGSWGEIGIGPCNFRREWQDFAVRYADYRQLNVNLNLDGQTISIRPSTDTQHAADADNAIFYENSYYDGQCEPQYRNIPIRDSVRAQPVEPDFSNVPIQDPPDVTPPMSVAIEPRDNDVVTSGPVPFYYYVDDLGGTGATSTAAFYLDGQVVTNTGTNPVWLNLMPGIHTWQCGGADNAGNSSLSALRTIIVTNTLGFNITSLQMINGVAVLNVQGAPGQTHQIQATTNLNPPIDWIPIATNMADSNGLFFSVDTQASNYMQRYYRSLRP